MTDSKSVTDKIRIYPPKGAAKAEPKVVQLFLLMFYPPKGDA